MKFEVEDFYFMSIIFKKKMNFKNHVVIVNNRGLTGLLIENKN